jgi:biopolymer transport protein ExbB/TolQ
VLNIRELIGNMGPVAWGVVVILAAMSVASFAVVLERYRTLSRAVRSSRQVVADVAMLLKAGRLREAAAWCHSDEAAASHVARTIRAGLEEWLAGAECGDRPIDREAAAAAAKDAALQMATLEQSNLRRGLSLLATIGSTAPFVGLFGTTFGIIDAFKSVGVTGSTGFGAISTGIAEALVTTAFGLLVAVPAVWAYNYFANRVERMGCEMDRSSYELAAFLSRHADRTAS